MKQSFAVEIDSSGMLSSGMAVLMRLADVVAVREHHVRHGGAMTQTATSGSLAALASTAHDACRSAINVAGCRAGPQ
jgi:hypothetical protein